MSRSKPDSPADVLSSFLERRLEVVGAAAGSGRKIRFFMIGDRYDNDCKPLLEMFPARKGRVGVGTCRLLSGKRATDFCPPLPQGQRSDLPDPPHTLYVCDTLAQIGHILHSTSSWESVEPVADVTPPLLLEPQGDVIYYYGPVTKSSGSTNLRPLAPKFRELSWARIDEELKTVPAIRDMLDQIERDLLVCGPEGVMRFLDQVAKDVKGWWQEAGRRRGSSRIEDPSILLFKGALDFLSGINRWHRLLSRPLLERSHDNFSATLESVLGSCLLRRMRISKLDTRFGRLQWAEEVQHAVDPKAVLKALPYSTAGEVIVTACLALHHDFMVDEMQDWLGVARTLRSNQDGSQP